MRTLLLAALEPNPHLTRSYIYTGGADSIARIWRPELGTDQEPDTASEAIEPVTTIAAAVRAFVCMLPRELTVFSLMGGSQEAMIVRSDNTPKEKPTCKVW